MRILRTVHRGLVNRRFLATVDGIVSENGIRIKAESGTRSGIATEIDYRNGMAGLVTVPVALEGAVVEVVGVAAAEAVVEVEGVEEVAEVRKVATGVSVVRLAARWIGRWPREWEWDVTLDLASSSS